MRVVVNGLAGLQERLDGVAARVANLEPVMAFVRADAERFVQENVRARRSPDGTSWAPFDDDTIRQGGGNASTIEELAASVVAQGLDGASFTLGSAEDFARFWQFGTEHMPARPFLPTPDAAVIQAWVRWIEAYITTGELP